MREFQLVLLRRMADYQPIMVEDARRGLGASTTDMRAANAWWQRFLRSPGAPRGVGRHVAVLGPARVGERRLGPDPDAPRCRLHRWELPLWPGLRFEVMTGPDGVVWQEWLVRERAAGDPPVLSAGAATPAARLRPWQVVVADVEHAYAPVRHRTPDPPSRWATEFRAPDGSGEPGLFVARFVWGLLQVVEPCGPPPGRPGTRTG